MMIKCSRIQSGFTTVFCSLFKRIGLWGTRAVIKKALELQVAQSLNTSAHRVKLLNDIKGMLFQMFKIPHKPSVLDTLKHISNEIPDLKSIEEEIKETLHEIQRNNFGHH